MAEKSAFRTDMIADLLAAEGERMPTSSFRRLGRTALTALNTARLVRKNNRDRAKNGDAELGAEQLVRIVTSIGRLKGVAMKMGQIMSYIDMAMPEELRNALAVLQTHAQPMTFERVRELVSAELGETAPALLAEMEPKPVSAASIGQVHRARLPEGTAVAVKIQYPEMARAIENDFGPAAVGTKMASLFYPNAHIDDFVKEARERFLEECDYLHEAHCQQQFARIYRDHPVLLVPAVHDAYCSRRVLTTTFVDGLSFDAFLETDPSADVRDSIGEALFGFYIGSLFLHQIYNCDPHPGNYLFRSDGRVAMLDHGCTRQFEPTFVAKLVNLTRAIHSDERETIHRALLDLNIVRDGKKYDFDAIHSLLHGFYGPMLRDEVAGVDLSAAMEMREVFKKKQKLLKFNLPGEFLFLFRIRFGLMSVLSRLGARANWFQLERGYAAEFAAAYPLLTESPGGSPARE